MNNREEGIKGENQAVKYLQEKGYKILDRNFNTRVGEIDIVAKDGEYIVFVEVKAKESASFGQPYEMVTREKMRKIIMTAKLYLMKNKKYSENIRFDIISILRGEVEHFENAFDLNY